MKPLLLKPQLLLTGGTGMVGALLLPELRRSYRIRISTHTPSPPGTITADDELLVGDLRDAAFARHCVTGSDVVIHLAASASPAASVGEALANVELAANIFDAAEAAGVSRLVVASSVHASGLDYRDGVNGISPLNVPRPCCPYGMGKVAVESLARLHQARTGGAVSCLRLGLTGWDLTERQYAHTWLSAADLHTFVDAALNRAAGFGIYHAVSADSAVRWDTSNARQDLSWTPRDRWPLDVDQLPLATNCPHPCRMFSVESQAS